MEAWKRQWLACATCLTSFITAWPLVEGQAGGQGTSSLCLSLPLSLFAHSLLPQTVAVSGLVVGTFFLWAGRLEGWNRHCWQKSPPPLGRREGTLRGGGEGRPHHTSACPLPLSCLASHLPLPFTTCHLFLPSFLFCLAWRPGGRQKAWPSHACTHTPGQACTEEKEALITSPLSSSPLLFLPLSFWEGRKEKERKESSAHLHTTHLPSFCLFSFIFLAENTFCISLYLPLSLFGAGVQEWVEKEKGRGQELAHLPVAALSPLYIEEGAHMGGKGELPLSLSSFYSCLALLSAIFFHAICLLPSCHSPHSFPFMRKKGTHSPLACLGMTFWQAGGTLCLPLPSFSSFCLPSFCLKGRKKGRRRKEEEEEGEAGEHCLTSLPPLCRTPSSCIPSLTIFLPHALSLFFTSCPSFSSALIKHLSLKGRAPASLRWAFSLCACINREGRTAQGTHAVTLAHLVPLYQCARAKHRAHRAALPRISFSFA